MKQRSNLKQWLVGIFTLSLVSFFVTRTANIDFPGTEKPANSIQSLSAINGQANETDSVQSEQTVERVIFNGEPPYLVEFPILDNNLYIKHDNNTFVLGGSNLSLIRYGAWTNSGAKATALNREQTIEFELSERPYIEFSYKGSFYSIEMIGRIYSVRMELRELSEATIELNSKFE